MVMWMLNLPSHVTTHRVKIFRKKVDQNTFPKAWGMGRMYSQYLNGEREGGGDERWRGISKAICPLWSNTDHPQWLLIWFWLLIRNFQERGGFYFSNINVLFCFVFHRSLTCTVFVFWGHEHPLLNRLISRCLLKSHELKKNQLQECSCSWHRFY